jgi:hypothetical protein
MNWIWDWILENQASEMRLLWSVIYVKVSRRGKIKTQWRSYIQKNFMENKKHYQQNTYLS